VSNNLFVRGDVVAIGASGGKGSMEPQYPLYFLLILIVISSEMKHLFLIFPNYVRFTLVNCTHLVLWCGVVCPCWTDSTVLAHIMKLLNTRYDYGLNLVLLSIDEGITGYRDDSLESVKRNQTEYEIPLKILSYKVRTRQSHDCVC